MQSRRVGNQGAVRLRKTAIACALAGLWAMAAPSLAGQSDEQMLQPAAPVKERAKGLIIKYRDADSAAELQQSAASPAARQRAQRRLDEIALRTNRKLRHIRAVVGDAQLVDTDEDADLDDLAEQLKRDPRVEYVEPNAIMRPLLTPNDTRYSEQWHYFEATGGLNLPPAWDQATGAGVNVAVLDTGIVPHSDLNANVVGGYDFVSDAAAARDGNGRDSNPRDEGDWYLAGECGRAQGGNSSWHGTHVAGTIAAVTNNSAGVAGVAFGARIIPVRVLAKCGGTLADIADAIVWASGGSVAGVPANPYPAKIINMSLGGSGACNATYQNAIDSARSRGTVVVVAAGNNNSNAANFRPASCAGVIAVAATTRSGGKASFSNFGAPVDVAAPGQGILSTLNAGATTPGAESLASYSGTSMAAPHTAGAAALLFQVKPAATPDEIESTLKSSARAFPATCNQCGTGIVDAAAAVTALKATLPPPPPPPPPPGNALENGVGVRVSGKIDTNKRFTLAVPAGQTSLTFTIRGGTGDADLYVRFNRKPTLLRFKCRPYLIGNDETCAISNVREGTYHVMLRGRSDYSRVTLTGTYSATTP